MHDPKTLLITEDAVEADKITKYLDSLGFMVKIRGFRDEAIFKEDLLNHDLILFDQNINPNGMETFKTIKTGLDVPVVYMGSEAEEDSKFPDTLLYIKKPVDHGELKSKVEIALYKHRMENALHESEKKYKLLIENADDPIMVIDKDGKFLLINQSGAKYFGGVPGDFKGKNMWDIFPKPHADSQMRSIKNVIRKGKSIVIEEKTLINNQEKWFSTKLQPIKDSNGIISSVQLIARDITSQKDFEHDLIERENFFSGTLNDMHTFVAMLKPTGEIIFVNNTPLDIIGCKLKDLEGTLFYETPWWDYSEKVKASIKRDIELCASGKTLAHEIQINSSNGLIWIDYSMHPVYDGKGNVKYLVPEGRDISRIKNAKKDLNAEKNRLMSLTENAPFGMVLIDGNGDYKYINPKFRDMFGYTIEDIPNGREWFRRAFEDSEKRHEAILTWKNDFKDAKPGEKRPRTFEVSCKDGEKKIVDFVPVMLENNEYLMTVDDVTERKIAENTLQESEERFRTVASSAVDAIIITDL